MSRLTAAHIRRALEENSWDLGNNCLYELCEKYPDHKNASEIIAKVWLIGRSYSAAIERRKTNPSSVSGDSFYKNEVAKIIQRSPIDNWFRAIRKSPQQERELTLLEVHQKLTDLFEDISGMKKRSLASKYLHFHFPGHYFIYDSRANNAVRKLIPGKKHLKIQIPNHDMEYAQFYYRCIGLKTEIENQIGRQLTPRDVDKILIYER